MIITCPSCSARYDVAAAGFSPAGRKVRCAKCGESWHQEPEAIAVDVDSADKAAVVAEGDSGSTESETPETESFEQETAEVKAAASEETTPPVQEEVDLEGDSAFAEPEPVVEPAQKTPKRKTPQKKPVAGQRSVRQQLAVAAGWTLLALFVGGTAYGFSSYKTDIVRLWPATATLYAAFNDPVDLRGMEFQQVAYKHVYEDGVPVLSISGQVVNVSDARLSVPKVRVGLRDENKKELYYWTFGLPETALEPEQSAEFVTRLSAPPVSAKDLEITFVTPEPLPQS
jgi:predicted Zn finger-like uncharacterized protein